jgi:hypothetical protein
MGTDVSEKHAHPTIIRVERSSSLCFLRNVEIHLKDTWIITEKATIRTSGYIEHTTISQAFSPGELPLDNLIFIISLTRQKIKYSLHLFQRVFFHQHFQTF